MKLSAPQRRALERLRGRGFLEWAGKRHVGRIWPGGYWVHGSTAMNLLNRGFIEQSALEEPNAFGECRYVITDYGVRAIGRSERVGR